MVQIVCTINEQDKKRTNNEQTLQRLIVQIIAQ